MTSVPTLTVVAMHNIYTSACVAIPSMSLTRRMIDLGRLQFNLQVARSYFRLHRLAPWLPGECTTQCDIDVCPLKSLATYSMVVAMGIPEAGY